MCWHVEKPKCVCVCEELFIDYVPKHSRRNQVLKQCIRRQLFSALGSAPFCCNSILLRAASHSGPAF